MLKRRRIALVVLVVLAVSGPAFGDCQKNAGGEVICGRGRCIIDLEASVAPCQTSRARR